MSKEKLPIESIDWRYRAATTLTKDWKSPDTGILYEKGSSITVVTYIKHGEKRISIGDPSAPALFLSLFYKFHEQALKKHPFLVDCPISNKKRSYYCNLRLFRINHGFNNFCLYCY